MRKTTDVRNSLLFFFFSVEIHVTYKESAADAVAHTRAAAATARICIWMFHVCK